MAGTLYIVATPIGNLEDVTLRALRILNEVDLIAAEDTRVTRKLLTRFDIHTKLTSFFAGNESEKAGAIIAELEGGHDVALVSDAGTPLISDPGYRLVSECHEQGIAVTALPGASAVLTGMVLSGLPSDRFLFAGFLPNKHKARCDTLRELSDVPATLVFYETGPRLGASLADMEDVLGARPGCVARELTKKFEEVRTGTLSELSAHYAQCDPPKGEIVVVIAPPDASDGGVSAEKLDMMLRRAMSEMSLRDAVAEVAGETGMRRKQVYNRALELEKQPDDHADDP